MLTKSLKTKIIYYLNSKTNTRGWEVNYPKIQSTEATVYRFSNPNYPIDLALKMFNQDYSSKIEKQYSAFERFSTALNRIDGKYRIPETYGLFLNENCFLIEWITGYSLREILWKNCLRKKPIQNYISASCRWLSHFHKNGDLKTRRVDNLRYVKSLEISSQNKDVENLCNDNQVFIEGLKTLKKYANYFSDYQTEHADIHGDLSLKNIIINRDYVAGIDIGANYSAPIVDDISQMLSYICINYFNMLTQIDMHKSPEFWEIFNVIFDAYEYPKNPEDREFFLFVFLYQMLNRWISVYKFHNTDSSHSLPIKVLGKWRLYNAKIIVRGLTRVINKKLVS